MSTTWKPTLAFLVDLLSIVTLKSIILGCNNKEKKQVYEKEAREIMNSIDKLTKKGEGRKIRAIQLNMWTNYTIWLNETKARQGGDSQNHLLPLTHSLNGMRMRAGNELIKYSGGRKDLNLDRVNEELIREFGFDLGGLFE